MGDPQEKGKNLIRSRELLLYGGLAGPAFYLLADVAGNIDTPGYSFVENAVSELVQAGTGPGFLNAVLLVSSLMFVCFGSGMVLRFPRRRNRLLFATGVLFMALGGVSALTGTVLPMDPVGSKITVKGFLHLALTGASVLALFPLILMAGIGLDREFGFRFFKNYSFFTLAAIVLSGGMTVVVVVRELPVLGLVERVNVYAYLAWVSALANNLVRRRDEQ